MSDQPTKAATELRPGDRIAEGFLPLGDAATVLFVEAYTGRLRGDDWVFVVHRTDGYGPESDVFAAAARIPVELVDTGLTYTRADSEDDDPRPVSPARVPLHIGSVVAGDRLVVDSAEQEPTCLYRTSSGAPCGISMQWHKSAAAWVHADDRWRGHDAVGPTS